VSALTLRVGAGGQIREDAATFADIDPVWQHKVMEIVNLAAIHAGTKPWPNQAQDPGAAPALAQTGSLIIESDVDPITDKVRCLPIRHVFSLCRSVKFVSMRRPRQA